MLSRFLSEEERERSRDVGRGVEGLERTVSCGKFGLDKACLLRGYVAANHT